jgi:hypothetical protein
MDDDELDFPFARPARFEGLELPDHLTCNPRALREGYLEALGTYLEEIRRGCAHNTRARAVKLRASPRCALHGHGRAAVARVREVTPRIVRRSV